MFGEQGVEGVIFEGIMRADVACDSSYVVGVTDFAFPGQDLNVILVGGDDGDKLMGQFDEVEASITALTTGRGLLPFTKNDRMLNLEGAEPDGVHEPLQELRTDDVPVQVLLVVGHLK